MGTPAQFTRSAAAERDQDDIDQDSYETDTAGSGDDETTARAAEAEALLAPPEVDREGSLTPEGLEEELEGAPTPAEASLHLADPLTEALLDEGDDDSLDETEDVDTLDYQVDRRTPHR